MKTFKHLGQVYQEVKEVKDKHEQSKQKHIDIGDYVWSYANGDYYWIKDGVYHLIRNGKEIATGDYVWSYANGDYYCVSMTATDCESMTATDCYDLILLYSDGTADKCYISDNHKSNFIITNPRKKSDYNKMFLENLKEGKRYYAYKYLTANWESPVNNKKIKYKTGETYTEECDKDVKNDCSYGINLATLNWCKKEKDKDDIIVKFEFNKKDAVIPNKTNGKFRVSKCKCLEVIN